MNQMNYWNNIYKLNPQIWGVDINPLVEFLGDHLKPGQRVLDLGCGTGRDCQYLNQKGIDTIGIDISEEAINFANNSSREKSFASPYFVCADFSEFINTYHESCFDGIISINSLNHVNDSLEVTVQKLDKILKPQGYLCLSLFSMDDEEWTKYEQIDQKTYQGPFGFIRLYSEDDIQKSLHKFNILKLFQVTYSDNPHLGSPKPHKNSFWKVIAEKN